MKAWITKYALTHGIQKVDDAVVSTVSKGMISTTPIGAGVCFHGEGREWHRSLESAKAKAEAMRLAKIKSLRKAIEKIEKLEF